MSEDQRTAFVARFKPQTYRQLFEEASSRDVSIRQVIDDAVNLYFNAKGSELWQKTLSSGQN